MFASDLDKSTQAMLARGHRTTEVLKQDQYQPMAVEKQIVVIFAATSGFLDPIPVSDCRRYEKELLAWMDRSQAALLAEVRDKKDIKGELSERLKAALTEFASVFQPSAKA
jgi:F-type H+-transporting ATPase subunit alpha